MIQLNDSLIEDIGIAMTDSESDAYLNIETGNIVYMFDGWDEEEIADVEENPGDYCKIESIPSYQSFGFMEEFAESVTNQKLQTNLNEALQRKKPFANFRNVLDNSDGDWLQKWYAFRDAKIAEHVKKWWAENGLGINI